MAFEFRGPAPLHEQIAAALRGRVEDGTYEPGFAIPTTRELCDEFGVTHNTVRAAVAILIEEGLLVGARGRGVFVTEPDERPDSGTPADQ